MAQIMQVYTIRDRLAKESGPVFESKNNNTALRFYRSGLAAQKLPESEYELYRIGAIDHETDRFVVLDQPELIVVGEINEQGI